MSDNGPSTPNTPNPSTPKPVSVAKPIVYAAEAGSPRSTPKGTEIMDVIDKRNAAYVPCTPGAIREQAGKLLIGAGLQQLAQRQQAPTSARLPAAPQLPYSSPYHQSSPAQIQPYPTAFPVSVKAELGNQQDVPSGHPQVPSRVQPVPAYSAAAAQPVVVLSPSPPSLSHSSTPGKRRKRSPEKIIAAVAGTILVGGTLAVAALSFQGNQRPKNPIVSTPASSVQKAPSVAPTVKTTVAPSAVPKAASSGSSKR